MAVASNATAHTIRLRSEWRVIRSELRLGRRMYLPLGGNSGAIRLAVELRGAKSASGSRPFSHSMYSGGSCSASKPGKSD